MLAFLDISPVSVGHTLVIPKEAAATLDQLSDESAAAIGRALPRICRAVMAATGTTAYNILQNNGPGAHQAVFHVHFHVIPRFKGRGIPVQGKPDKNNGPGLEFSWKPGTLTQEEAVEIGKHIKRLL